MPRWMQIKPGAFRLLLAVLVFVSHVSRFNSGRPAVVVFFMLSGYWVTRLYDERSASVGAYLRDRFLRVWPLLATVAIAVVAAGILRGKPTAGNLGSTLALLGLATRHGDVIGVAWSLDVEAQFYLLLPLALALLALVPPPTRAFAAIAAVVLTTLTGSALLESQVVTALAYAPAFACGAAIWLARWFPRGRLALASVAGFLVLLFGLAALPALRWLVVGSMMPWWHDLAAMLVCLVLVPFVAWNVNQPSSARDRDLGNLSYPFYLVHFPLVAGFAGLTGHTPVDKLLAFAATCTATLLLYVVIDRPLEKVRRGKVAWRR